MLSAKTLATLLLAASSAVAVPAAVGRGDAPSIKACYDETSALHCYNGDNDIPQDVDVDDVAYIAAYLRAYGRETKNGRCKFNVGTCQIL